MPYAFYHIIHVFFLFIYTALTFGAFGNPSPQRKKFIMRSTGMMMALVFVAGFGLAAKSGFSITTPWILVKLVIWLILTGLPGMIYRQPGMIPKLRVLVPVLIFIAVLMVSLKPF